MHHDPRCAPARKPLFSFGHIWVVRALGVPLPLDPVCSFALPILFRLYRSTKRGGQAASPSGPTKQELARELLTIVA